jgi:1,4-alpha-glucan branching enzyme
MGEEFAETNPFLFFTDFHGDLAKAVREGRAKEFAGHAGHDASVPDPNDPRTFIRSKLDWQKAASEEGKPGCASRATLSSCAIATSSRCSRREGPWRA